jgi:endonuclease/exonuclease/phosphatase family metal-dependent hydrolase
MVIDSGDIWLSRTPEVPGSSLENHSFPRLCVWGLFYSYQKKSLLLVANMHLDHQDASLRLKQVKIFIEEFKKIEKKCSTVGMILCGDFNEAAGGAVYQALHEAFPQLRDGWLEIAKSRGKSLHGPSFHKFSYSYYDAQRIDWIFLDQSFSIHDTFFDQTHDSGIFPSDHYPLILETTW